MDLSSTFKSHRKGTDITPGPDSNERFDIGTIEKEEIDRELAEPKELDSELHSPENPERCNLKPNKICNKNPTNLNKFINKSKATEGRYNHKRFMEAFSKSFIKFYKEMQRSESPLRRNVAQRGTPIDLSDHSVGRELMDTDCRTDISKLVLQRIDRYKSSKRRDLSLMKRNIFNVKTNSQFARRSQNISSSKYNNRSFLLDVKSGYRKDRSTMTPGKNYIMLNKNFVEQVSRINHEINMDLVEPNEPRYKFPRPETLLNLVHFNESASPSFS